MNPRPSILAVAALLAALVAAVPASAAPAAPVLPGHGAHAAIDAAASAGLLSPEAARLQRFYAVFRPDLLDPAYAEFSEDDNPRCATALLADVKAHWDELSGTERHVVDEASSPIYRQWLADGGMTWEHGDVDAEMAAARSICFSPEVATGAGPFDNVHTTDNFSIHYDLGGPVTHDRVETLGDAFEESLVREATELGFFWPNNLTSYEMLVVVASLPSENTGGYTTVNQCGLTGYMAYIVVNTAWFDDQQRLQSLAPHELFHAIQLEYAFLEMFQGESDNRWLIESTATYMETNVYPTLFNSQLSQAFRWITQPHRSITTEDNTGFQYGSYVFHASAREFLGTDQWHSDLWNNIHERQGYDIIDELDQVFATFGSSFDEVYADFVRRMTTADFEFNTYLPGPAELEEISNGFYDNALVGSHDADDLPLDESVDSGASGDRPEFLGTNFVWIDSDGVNDDFGVVIRVEGAGQKNNTELTWTVQLVAVDGDDQKAHHDLVMEPILDANGTVDRWGGEILLNDFGEDFDGVFIAASPTTDFGEGGATWHYQVWFEGSRGDGGFVPVPVADDGDGDDGGEGCSACGSSLGGAAIGPSERAPLVGASLLLLAALGLKRRRRR